MKIVRFTALWCADCIVMRPYWLEISSKYPDLEIVEIDFDDNPELAAQHGVKKVPHTIFYGQDGAVLKSLEGMQNKADLFKLIEDHK